MQNQVIKQFPVFRFREKHPTVPDLDDLTIEEPLEIRVSFRRGSSRVERPVAITMRTPGHDRELAAGFLYTEGIIHEPSCIESVESEPVRGESVLVRLKQPVDLRRLERHFFTNSSCGVCGKASLTALEMNRLVRLVPQQPQMYAQTLLGLPAALAERQQIFQQTGSLHAAAFFDAGGKLLCVHEDIGRHNAVDKLIGSVLLQTATDLFPTLTLMVSGRAGFELVQKAIMSGVAFFAAVGAPSSIAVELARRYGQTLVGFLRDRRFNVYSGAERIVR